MLIFRLVIAVSGVVSEVEYRRRVHGIPDVLVRDDQWSVWDGNTIIPSSSNLTCNWQQYNTGHVLVPICVRQAVGGYVDRITRIVSSLGFWFDCSVGFVRFWDGFGEGFFVDVGANMGSCVLQMLMTTKSKIFAFEPHPDNLFCLTSTLSNLPEDLRARVALFPIAVGDIDHEAGISCAPDNFGGCTVSYETQRSIIVRSLDNIFRSPFPIQFMKLDIEGFECKVLDGMRRLLPNIHRIKAEADDFLLQRQGCSVDGLVERLDGFGSVEWPTATDVTVVRSLDPVADVRQQTFLCWSDGFTYDGCCFGHDQICFQPPFLESFCCKGV